MKTLALLFGLVQLPGLCADWNPKLAAAYLDARQKEWSAWAPAAAPGGACVSCHTGMTYLLARPELRRILGEGQATPYEKGLLDSLRARVDLNNPKEGYGHFTKEPLSSEALGVGKAKGSWPWFELDLDPWETTDSPYYGAVVAALAVGAASPAYRERPEIREDIAALSSYLRREQPSQPLHNRLMLLWAASALPGTLSESNRKQVIEDVLEKQQADGGWTLASLGPWKESPTAAPSVGSNAYATGFATFVLLKAGVDHSDPRLTRGLTRALDWLRAQQNAQGYWEASSMNKRFTPNSMQDLFMRDAATGFAALALVEAGETRITRSAR